MVNCTTDVFDSQEVDERHILLLGSGAATIFVIVVGAAMFVSDHAIMTMVVVLRCSRRFPWRREGDVSGSVALPDTERS